MNVYLMADRAVNNNIGMGSLKAASGRGSGRCRLLLSFSRFFIFRFSLLSLLFLSLDGFCQPGAELGVMAGGGYYLGDYNPSRHFSNTQRYLGGFYRYNLNDRFAIRLNAGFSKIDVQNAKMPDRAGMEFPAGFHRSVIDIAGLVEFNFRSFMVAKVKESSFWSPYLFTGIGFLAADDEGGVTIPLGAGVKFNIYRQISCGIEWSVRKTFTDSLDGLSDPWNTGEGNFIYNKDWFFVAGVTLSFRFPTSPECHW